MIVKIWPVMADYSGEESKVGGIEGLKNAYNYITDHEKVMVKENEPQPNDSDEDFTGEYDADDLYENSKERVLSYMANEDKIKGKYISGYLCDPDFAVEEFNNTKTCVLKISNRQKQKETGAVAYHMVQSFPEGLEISDEEVHQCGIELCQKLGVHQAVICSHVHPVKDEEGEIHGKSKHNHILFNAYIHESKWDPQKPNVLKYNDCNETYAQLRAWNDEIAINHGLPIIRNPDNDRLYSWFEENSINEGLSWKQRVRVDIQEAKRASGNWEEFIEQMEMNGYKIRDGVHTSYTTPDGKHKVRGKILGRQYTKENLQMYWNVRDYTLNAIVQDQKLNDSPPLLDVVLMTQGPLHAAIPLGMKNEEIKTFYHLPLESVQQSTDTLRTYFNETERYDICDEKNRTVISVPGKEIIDCMDQLRNGKEAYMQDHNISQEENKQVQQKDIERREKEKYYINARFINSRTKKPYQTSLYDDNGRRRSMLELMLILAILIIKSEDGLWDLDRLPPESDKEPVFAKSDWKIQNMLDAMYTADEENIETPAQLQQRVNEVGAAKSRAQSALKKTVRAKDKMEILNDAVKQYRKTQTIAEQILAMPDGPEKTEAMEEYKDILNQYRSAKAVLYRFNVITEDEILDFEQRYVKIQKDIKDLEVHLDQANEEYRKIKKLSYNIELAQNAQYCYGPAYSVEDLYMHHQQNEQEHESNESRNKQPEKNLNDLIENSMISRLEPEKEQGDAEKEISKQ